jgi:glycosyltransferase involved in cell wall biosynthesis
MKVLLLHNSYQQPGGEDRVFALEADMLRAHGHEVVVYRAHNDEVKDKNPLSLFADTIWNRKAYRDVHNLIRLERPEILHAHNTFPLISPAVFHAAEQERVPVVQTLHNFRLLCPSATFFRAGRVCEDCVKTVVPWPGVLHACYRDSVPATAATAAMLTVHRALKTWERKISVYISLTDFARSKFIQGGLLAEKLVVKPNFVHPDPGLATGDGGYALFLGRLTPEKGIGTLLEAWSRLGKTFPLEIAGDGPLAPRVAKAVEHGSSIRWLGWLPRDQVLERMRHASVLIVPSIWYEAFPMVIVEAFAMGIPVIVSKLGSMSSIVDHGRTGLHFAAGDALDLAAQFKNFRDHSEQSAYMREQARREFETKYTREHNYGQLIQIYDRARSSGRGTSLGDIINPEHMPKGSAPIF